MDAKTISVQIAGQSYKLTSSATDDELQRLAATVSAKIEELTPSGRVATSQSVLLAAIALAHDLEEERERRAAVESRARDMLRRVLSRLDDAIASTEN